MRKHIFEFYNHRVTVAFVDSPPTMYNGIGMEFQDDRVTVVDAPCSVPLVIVNAFEFMLDNNVHRLDMDGTEIRRIT